MTEKIAKGDYPALDAFIREMLGLDESPIGFHYTDDEPKNAITALKKGRVCIYPFLNRVRKGDVVYFSKDWKVCRGGAFYLGYRKSLMKGIGHFLSHGVPGRLEGERFKKTPELGEALAEDIEFIPAGGDYIVFKPLAHFTKDNPPDAVIIYGNGDVMSALVVMANYARVGNDAVLSNFSSGCYSIITGPRIQSNIEKTKGGEPKALLGSFDVVCRTFLDPAILTFSMTANHLWEMAMNMDESFLSTNPWKKIRGRVGRGE